MWQAAASGLGSSGVLGRGHQTDGWDTPPDKRTSQPNQWKLAISAALSCQCLPSSCPVSQLIGTKGTRTSGPRTADRPEWSFERQGSATTWTLLLERASALSCDFVECEMSCGTRTSTFIRSAGSSEDQETPVSRQPIATIYLKNEALYDDFMMTAMTWFC